MVSFLRQAGLDPLLHIPDRIFEGYGPNVEAIRSLASRGARLLVNTFPTPDGKGHFSVVDLPEERAPKGMFILSTRRGKQFNSMVYGGKDPLTGAKRDAILISQSDALALGLGDGERIILRNELGEFHGSVKIDRIAAGNLQGYWPEVNGLVPAGCLDASGVPHYNAFVEIARAEAPSVAPVTEIAPVAAR